MMILFVCNRGIRSRRGLQGWVRGGVPGGGAEEGGGAMDSLLAQLGGLGRAATRPRAPEGRSLPRVEVGVSGEEFTEALFFFCCTKI